MSGGDNVPPLSFYILYFSETTQGEQQNEIILVFAFFDLNNFKPTVKHE